VDGNTRQDAAVQWRRRYEGRAVTRREEHARRYIEDGLAVFDPDGPYPGVDGSRYHPGVLDEDKGLPQLPVLLITSRGSAELVAGWDHYQQSCSQNFFQYRPSHPRSGAPAQALIAAVCGGRSA
jgi:hypothetical protein